METSRPWPVIWIASAGKHYNAFPPEMLDFFGYSLWQVQLGEDEVR